MELEALRLELVHCFGRVLSSVLICRNDPRGNGARFHTPLFDCALVVLLLALGQSDLDLDTIVFPVHRSRHNGVALAFDCPDQLVDFGAMQQQFACAPVVGDDVRGG